MATSSDTQRTPKPRPKRVCHPESSLPQALNPGLAQNLLSLDKLQDLVTEGTPIPELNPSTYVDFCKQMLDNVTPRRTTADQHQKAVDALGHSLDNDNTLRRHRLSTILDGLEGLLQQGQSAYAELQSIQDFAQMSACCQALLRIIKDQAELLRTFERDHVTASN